MTSTVQEAEILEAVKPIRRTTVWLAGSAIGVLLVLLCAPSTRWILLSQLRLSIPTAGAMAPISTPTAADADYADRAMREVAERNPNDLQLQIAASALLRTEQGGMNQGGMNGPIMVARLRALEARFPNRPELYANTLRFATQGEVMVHRMEEGLISARPTDKPFPSRPCKPEALAAFDREAAMGERLDPNNGYFPFMRAVGLFNANRDAEALAAVHRVVDKPEWREYYNQELTGEWRLVDLAFGNRSAIAHTATAAAILFPHYASLRGVARMELYYAIKAEQAGRFDEGLAIRKDLLACGRTLRTQACSLIGGLVGIALEHIAVARPGGAPANDTDASKKITTARQLDNFDAYLQRIGHAAEAGPFRSELLAGDRVKALAEAHPDGLWPFGDLFGRSVALWTLDTLLLSNALWLLLFGAGAALLMRRGRLQAGLPLSPALRWSLPTGLLAGAIIAPVIWHWDVWSFYVSAAVLTTVVLALPALVLPVAYRFDRWRRFGGYVCSALIACGLTGLVVWQAHGLVAFTGLIQSFYGDNANGHGAGLWLRMLTLSAYTTTLVSGLVLIAAAVVSGFCRVPLSVGVARAMRGLAIPVASGLMIVYGLMLLPTLRAEAPLQYVMARTMQGEGAYLAELDAKTWPDMSKR
jgi:hypothetical protein